MSVKLAIFGIILLLAFIAMILYLAFGEITVRRLRKNPETMGALGFDYISGRDIVNVAQALSWPAFMVRKLRTTKLAFLYADPDILVQYTSKFDRVLARLFYWSFAGSGVSIIIFAILESLGVFK
jgi:hypothetical protein